MNTKKANSTSSVVPATPKTECEKETARNNIRKHFTSLSDREIEAINFVPEMLDMTILDIMHDGKFTGEDMYDLLRPFISGPNVMSKICPNSEIKLQDRRHVNLKIMAAMRRVFGISIDKILDECFQLLEPRKPHEKS